MGGRDGKGGREGGGRDISETEEVEAETGHEKEMRSDQGMYRNIQRLRKLRAGMERI